MSEPEDGILARDHHTGDPVRLRVTDHPADMVALLIGADDVLVLSPSAAVLLAVELGYATRRHFLAGSAGPISGTY